VTTLPPAERYTYVFQGNSQVLDHVLVSPALAGRLTGFDVVHVNAEYADQATTTIPRWPGCASTPGRPTPASPRHPPR
jgi:hypothetical protein